MGEWSPLAVNITGHQERFLDIQRTTFVVPCFRHLGQLRRSTVVAKTRARGKLLASGRELTFDLQHLNIYLSSICVSSHPVPDLTVTAGGVTRCSSRSTCSITYSRSAPSIKYAPPGPATSRPAAKQRLRADFNSCRRLGHDLHHGTAGMMPCPQLGGA